MTAKDTTASVPSMIIQALGDASRRPAAVVETATCSAPASGASPAFTT